MRLNLESALAAAYSIKSGMLAVMNGHDTCSGSGLVFRKPLEYCDPKAQQNQTAARPSFGVLKTVLFRTRYAKEGLSRRKQNR